jgi:hypothetical protein
MQEKDIFYTFDHESEYGVPRIISNKSTADRYAVELYFAVVPTIIQVFRKPFVKE